MYYVLRQEDRNVLRKTSNVQPLKRLPQPNIKPALR